MEGVSKLHVRPLYPIQKRLFLLLCQERARRKQQKCGGDWEEVFQAGEGEFERYRGFTGWLTEWSGWVFKAASTE